MKFVVDITREHYFTYNKYAANKLKHEINKNKIIFFLSNLFWLLLVLYFISLYREYEHICKSNYKYILANFVILWSLLTVYYVYIKLYYKLFFENSVSENGATLGEMEIEITEKGLYARKSQLETFYHWAIFQKIESDNLCYYMILENVKALILPKEQINQEILMNIEKHINIV